MTLDSIRGNKKYIYNTVVLYFDNMVKLVIGFILSVFITRYFGPGRFGQLNYVTAYIGIFQVCVICGFDQIILKDIGLGLFADSIVIGTVIKCRLFLAAIIYSIGGLIFFAIRDKLLLQIYLISGLQLFMFSIYGLKQWFQVKILNKYAVIASLSAFFCVTIAKIIFLFLDLGLVEYSTLLIFGILIEITLLILFFHKKSTVKLPGRFSISYCKHLFKDSYFLLLQGFAIMVFMKIDQIMIGSMLPKQELGIYSLGVTISEVIHFVPMGVINGMYPKIAKAEKNGNVNALLIKIGSVNWIICLIFALACNFFFPFFIGLLFGPDYIRVVDVIKIHSWATIFVAIGVSQSPLVVFRNMQKYTFYATLFGAILNITLNYFMINLWGINGAAIATLITQAVTSYLFYALLKDKTFFINETKSLFFRFG
jgi:PST family polysaccharide transporter